MIGMRWIIRAIGLVNTVILARLLTPADFGIIAMASVAVSFLDAMGDFNVETALVRSTSRGALSLRQRLDATGDRRGGENSTVDLLLHRSLLAIMAIHESNWSFTSSPFVQVSKASRT